MAMEDQFGGRTDDDLFYDDLEPFQGEPIVVREVVSSPPVISAVSAIPSPKQSIKTRKVDADSVPVSRSALPPAKSLSSSRFADNSKRPSKSPKQTEKPTASPPANAPTAPKDMPAKGSTPQTGSSDPAVRLQSGANPRQKLTEDELATKMNEMKLLSAEKTRKFEKAERDEQQHAAAYAKGMEDARKRKLEEAERRKRGDEAKKKMEDERDKNRERKLKAMGMKEGGWDEGKEAILEEEAKRTFSGANGGVRGARGGGLGNSRYAPRGEPEQDVDRFLDDRHRRGGRGRGGGARGRGGRGGERGGYHDAPTPRKNEAGVVPKPEDFPALAPSSQPRKAENTSSPRVTSVPGMKANKPSTDEPPLSAPISGKWGDEMEELDALKKT